MKTGAIGGWLLVGVLAAAALGTNAEAKRREVREAGGCAQSEWSIREACRDCIAKGGRWLEDERAMACVRTDGTWLGCSKKTGKCRTGGGPGGMIRDQLRVAPQTRATAPAATPRPLRPGGEASPHRRPEKSAARPDAHGDAALDADLGRLLDEASR
ncbi:MAG: hypothetical protein KatS3mg121_1226 [Gammaproteobacteria bacterium]|nr:MAG: hypothetical protein KatS3mg121_1226 [Gammaproteobacteria bacterium]